MTDNDYQPLYLNSDRVLVGKNFSKNTNKKRPENDFYQTPYSITEQLLENHTFDFSRPILEPASGGGAITRVISKYFNEVKSYDLRTGKNFFDEKNEYDYIITNPPFKLANQFIKKCLQITRYQFCLLLPLNYLHGRERYINFFKNDNCLKYVYVFTRYALLSQIIREDGRYDTGMQVYAWFVWEKGYTGDPVVKWIDNNKYILNKRDKHELQKV